MDYPRYIWGNGAGNLYEKPEVVGSSVCCGDIVLCDCVLLGQQEHTFMEFMDRVCFARRKAIHGCRSLYWGCLLPSFPFPYGGEFLFLGKNGFAADRGEWAF